ncbi:hypothetical protein BAE44_0023890 [Dichanthelium oligosanthes]|uniref:Nuclease HARBI1 n=1 Tax=Dichanthelium oligosanthes TaxID=888268 RepID=A0A1E5UQE6_9POAL|nr:hypothetical protein BAE44_0023890 [Dichanthelium oligosanthes]
MQDLDDDAAVAQRMAEEAEARQRRRRGSVPGHIVIDRDHGTGHVRIIADYFNDNPVYTYYHFRRRYRMRRSLFLRIMAAVTQRDEWFLCRPDATGKMGLSSLQKCIAPLRIMAYGLPADVVDDYVRISESMATEALNMFCAAVVDVFEEQYLRAPTTSDVAALLQVNALRGFPGMLGSVDCMHWDWKNCPTAWKGMFTGHRRNPSMILEAVASYDLWI